MGSSSKIQEFPYGFKTAAISNFIVCTHKYYFRLVPPQNLLEYKNMVAQIIFQFGVGTVVGDRKIVSVGVTSGDFSYTTNPSRFKRITGNWAADVNRRVSITQDLTAMLHPTQDNYLEIIFSDVFASAYDFGVWELLKLDMLYTSKGIR